MKRRNHDVEVLKKRLDKHGDNWRSVPMVAPHPKGKTEQKRRGPKPKNKPGADGGEASTTGSNPPAVRKPRKQRAKQQPPTTNLSASIPLPQPTQTQMGT